MFGPAARSAVAAGLAAPLDGRVAAILCRTRSGELRPATRTARPDRTPWAGLPRLPAVMAILNVTPDSFSDGGTHPDPIAAGRTMCEQGADIIDIGGESTRPGAQPVSPDEEQRRILPVIEALARDGARISVDTRNAATMRRALDAGAAIVNDVSALTHDPDASATVARAACPVILMHMRGTPATMGHFAHYQDVATDVLAELTQRYQAALAAGIDPAAIAIDPGFGFAKTPSQSLELLRRLPILFHLPCPIIVGLSRKGFIGRMAGADHPKDRDSASLAAATLALSLGASVLRVHDVAASVQAVRLWRAIHGDRAEEETNA